MKIAYIYPDLLSLYGDFGNILCLKYRCEKRGIQVQIDEITYGLPLVDDYDIYFLGGGQDFEQSILVSDLKKYEKDLVIKSEIENDKSFLAICGGFQLLGKYYVKKDGERLDFIGALDFYTVASEERFVGNIAFKNGNTVGVGFENHSGKTYLNTVSPLGKVVKGHGNNGVDKTEGAYYKNTICTYLHGPFLPKNQEFADQIILNSLKKKYGVNNLSEIDDRLENNAKKHFIGKYLQKS